LHDKVISCWLRLAALLGLLSLSLLPCSATILGDVRGVVHDPQHHPVSGAHATLQSTNSAYQRAGITNPDGLFQFSGVPLGEYQVTVEAPGFATATQVLVLGAASAPVLHYQLNLSGAHESIDVTAPPADLNPESPRRDIFIDQQKITTTPGADASNSFKMITDFVPGSYVVHDQLHVRGGHQVTWAIDGVPVPNTNIASNVGPQFNPKDVDYMEAQTGSYGAEWGDRTYGVFNLAMRSGFERDREAELITSYGNFNSTDDQLSFGDHSEKFAYYASVSGNTTEYGLEPPTQDNLHNQAYGGGGFTSLIYNPNPTNQFRFNGGLRLDYYQVPNDLGMQAAGINDREREQDIFDTLSWVHTYSPGMMLTVSPFYHFNRAAYEGGASDNPSATDNRASNYEGGQLSLALVKGKHNARFGTYAFAQQDNTYFSVAANDGSGDDFAQTVTPGGNMEALFAEDQYRATRWLTLSGGLRYTHFAGNITENPVDPRFGVAIRVPKLGWIVRGAYSMFYQPPPLDTVAGSLLDFANGQGLGFLPLKGERDQQQEYGITIPFRGWAADLTYFNTLAKNFFDHDAIGNSNIFLPLTIQYARIKGFEVALRSPIIARHYSAHVVYSNQTAQGAGDVTGGLTDFSPSEEGYYYLDHDQRNTLSAGVTGNLPWRMFASLEFNYGSGFLDGDGPEHLPPNHTFDFSFGKNFGETFTLRFIGTNITNQQYLLDNSNTFGGTHLASPRMVSVQLKYRFKY
jgi:outer membrane receptor protein involved in Fe transport